MSECEDSTRGREKSIVNALRWKECVEVQVERRRTMRSGRREAELNAMSLECLQIQTRQDPEGNRQVLEII